MIRVIRTFFSRHFFAGMAAMFASNCASVVTSMSA